MEEKEERERGEEKEGKGEREEESNGLGTIIVLCSLKHPKDHTGMLPCELDGVGASVGDEGVEVGLHGVVVALGTHLTLPQGNAYTGHK